MGFDRRTAAAALAALAGIATVVLVVAFAGGGCTSGIYDGSFDGSGAGAPILVAITPNTEAVGRTSDGVFRVTVPAGAFTAPTTLTITPLAHRTVDGSEVPAYTVSADTKLAGKIAVSFTSTNGGSASFQVALEGVDGQLAPLAVGGRSGSVYFGVSDALGTFSLTQRAEHGLLDWSNSCFATCCKQKSNGAPATAAGASCQCQTGGAGGGNGSPDEETFRCFLGCPLAESGRRCEELAAEVKPFPCFSDAGGGGGGGPGSQSCGATTNGGGGGGGVQTSSLCCFQQTAPGNSFPVASCQNNECTGVSARCTATSQCPAGTTCCAGLADTFCAHTCALPSRVCTSSADCEGQPCQTNNVCPFGTCGPIPAGCY